MEQALTFICQTYIHVECYCYFSYKGSADSSSPVSAVAASGSMTISNRLSLFEAGEPLHSHANPDLPSPDQLLPLQVAAGWW